MAKVAIVGLGAMGSVYAGLMASAGHEVHGVTLWPDHAAAINAHGLRLTGASGERVAPIRAGTTTDGIGPCDLVIVATKAYDIDAAAASLAPLLRDDTPVQAVQNGLGSAERVAAVVGADRVAVGVVGGFGASVPAPGHAHHNGMEMIRFGAYAGMGRAMLEASAAPWLSAGFKVALFDDIGRMVWEKLIMNVAFSGPCALTGMTLGETMADADAWSVAEACSREAVAVAGAAGIALDVGEPIAHVRRLAGKIPLARPSTLLDVLAGRRCEIEAINGSICRLGRRHAVPTPVNDVVVALVKAKQAGLG